MLLASVKPAPGDALIVVDVQSDFLPGGALGVPHGDEVIPAIGRYLRLFHERGLPIFATRRWHPQDHRSFIGHGGPWPAHCIAGTGGAAFAPGLRLPPGTVVLAWGEQADDDARSPFQGTGLAQRLRQATITRLFVGGLATERGVLETVRDARNAGFEVVVLRDAYRAVDAQPGDGVAAEEEMRRLGAVDCVFAGISPAGAAPS